VHRKTIYFPACFHRESLAPVTAELVDSQR
jgi:hypothetical protein